MKETPTQRPRSRLLDMFPPITREPTPPDIADREEALANVRACLGGIRVAVTFDSAKAIGR